MEHSFRIKHKAILLAYFINTDLRYNHLMAQLDHESNLKPVRENLFYTKVSQARAVFKTPFSGKSDEFVSQYLRNPEKMANYVYANRNGNGNEASGDGWRYRAGGYVGITGKGIYLQLSKDTKIDFIGNPELITREDMALVSALWYWNKAKLNAYADIDDIDSISDIINIGSKTKRYGDSNGFEDRLKKYKYYDTISKSKK